MITLKMFRSFFLKWQNNNLVKEDKFKKICVNNLNLTLFAFRFEFTIVSDSFKSPSINIPVFFGGHVQISRAATLCLLTAIEYYIYLL